MIQLKNLSFQYQSSNIDKPQLKNISLNVKQGEFILFTGHSGCGKTTLTRILNGLCPQFYHGKLTGQYLLEGRDTSDMEISEIGIIIGSVFQDPRSQFFTLNTTDEIVLGMENNAMPRQQQEKRLVEAASQIGVDAILDRCIFPLSSGEKQRIAIASACAVEPKILVFDEPSANLDGDAIVRLSRLMYRLKEAGTTIILSEHRLHYAKELFDRMIVMDKGEIKEEYNRKEALSLSQDQLKKMGLRQFEAPIINLGKRVRQEESCCISTEKISISFSGQKILDDIDMFADEGKIFTIMGGNGSGKTTLCRVLTGLYQQNVGQVYISGEATKRKKRIWSTFFVQQDADYQLYAPTVEDEFRIGKANKVITRDKILSVLKGVGLEEEIDRHPLSLSGGQKQRLLLAIASVSSKKIIVLDEPTSGLDGYNMTLTAELIKNLAQKGHCIILITHDLELIESVSDGLLYLDKGSVKYHRTIE